MRGGIVLPLLLICQRFLIRSCQWQSGSETLHLGRWFYLQWITWIIIIFFSFPKELFYLENALIQLVPISQPICKIHVHFQCKWLYRGVKRNQFKKQLPKMMKNKKYTPQLFCSASAILWSVSTSVQYLLSGAYILYTYSNLAHTSLTVLWSKGMQWP